MGAAKWTTTGSSAETSGAISLNVLLTFVLVCSSRVGQMVSPAGTVSE